LILNSTYFCHAWLAISIVENLDHVEVIWGLERVGALPETLGGVYGPLPKPFP